MSDSINFIKLVPSFEFHLGLAGRTDGTVIKMGPELGAGGGVGLVLGPHRIDARLFGEVLGLKGKYFNESVSSGNIRVGGELDYGFSIIENSLSLHLNGRGGMNVYDNVVPAFSAGAGVCFLKDRVCAYGNYTTDSAIQGLDGFLALHI